MLNKLSQATQSAMKPGELNGRAVIGKSGMKRLNNQLAALMGRYYLILWTDQRMAVYKMRHPKSSRVGNLVWEGSLAAIPHGDAGESRISIGPCHLWVNRIAYPHLDDPAQ